MAVVGAPADSGTGRPLSPAPLIDYLAQLVGQPALAPRFR